MKDYIEVRIDKDDAIDMLMNRLTDRWVDDDDVYDLFEQMYTQYVNDGVFDGQEFNVPMIVDNDYVNYCDIIREDDSRYEECVEALESGDYEIKSGYIEAYKELDDGEYIFLVRA